MKKLFYLSLLTLVLVDVTNAQQNLQDFKYRRSSLAMVMIESDNFPNKEAVMSSWMNYPFPEKYNKHSSDFNSININNLQLTDQDLMDAGYLKDTLATTKDLLKATLKLTPLRYLDKEMTKAVVIPSEKQEFQIKINKVIKEKQLAKKMVSTWFNRGKDGKFDMSLIQERGFYNASELEAGIAQGQSRGRASLGDAGEELIKNTFLTFTKLDFYPNEPIAAAIRDLAKKEITERMAGSPEFLIDKALQVADKAYDKAKEGYSLWSKTWLYRLNWNDSISTIFYNTLWSNPAEFDKSDLFSLEFVGVQYNQSLVTFKIGETRTQEQIINLALVRNIDNAFAKLQKENDVFKPKVPVVSIDPIIAQIGMKEGLSGGEKFEVLEMTQNPETGLTEYKKIGTATADKKLIWDNRYNAGEKPEKEQLDKNGQPIKGTIFKGKKSVQPGMLLKQIK